ncbi:MAG TPA: YqeG family HAD IIIA-type phosphatase [Actinobacteria bacterium]|nr:YqeG family HAD IIIA-type phosphatase [Actinomycetota bacterium]
MLKRFTPDAYYDSIYDIQIEDLVGKGIKGLIIDLDNTLIPRDKTATPDKLMSWLKNLEKHGLRICVVSNNLRSRGNEISNKIKQPVISMAKKPSRAAFKKALEILDTPIDKTVVVGDQIFTDVFGGNRMGLKTILVVPLNGREFFATYFVRIVERFILRHLLRSKRIQKNKQVDFQ